MSTSCLSSATIVRCEALTGLQNGIVFVPVVVQTIFLAFISLFFFRSGRRKHFWLVAEGSSFYLVTLIDLLSHLIPMARTQLSVFRTFDIVIGALSFVPILFYILFIFLFTKRFFLLTLPRPFGIIAKYVLIALIPITIATYELGSFLGIRYQMFENAAGVKLLAIGFSSSTLQTLSQVFASITLVLLILYQAFFFLSSVYVGVSLSQERRVGGNFFEGFTMPTLAGIIWLAIGVKMGFAESILGFINGGFSIVLARRILRMLSRCCLITGSLLSEAANATIVDRQGRPHTASQIRAMISNPRHSTFVKLSPTAGTFLSARALEKMPEGHIPGAAQGGPFPRNQRVTVHYDGRHAPNLELRLSALDVPPAAVLTATFNKRGTIFENPRSTKPSLTRSVSEFIMPSGLSMDPEAFPANLRPVLGSRSRTLGPEEGLGSTSRNNPRYNVRSSTYSDEEDGSFILAIGHRRVMSASSIASDSLSVVRALVSQFPGLSPRRTASGRRRWSERRSSNVLSTALDNVQEVSEKPATTLSPSSSVKRKPPPSLTAFVSSEHISDQAQASHGDMSDSSTSKLSQSSSMRRRNNHIPPPIDTSQAGPDSRLSQNVVLSDDNEDKSAGARTPTGTQATPTRRRAKHAPGYSYSSVRSANTATQSQPTPGMTAGDISTSPDDNGPTTEREGPTGVALDPFADSDDESVPQLKADQLEVAESGLNRMAARVVEYDRMRRQSYRKGPSPTPFYSSNYKGKAPERVDFPKSAGPTISRPRPLSSLTESSSSPASARHASSTARRAPPFPNPSPTSPLRAFRQQQTHTHTVSQSSVATRKSHTDRELMHVKQVGRVGARRTPTPTPSTNSFATRQSMRIDSIDYSASARSATMDSEPDFDLDTEGSTGGLSASPETRRAPSIVNLREVRYLQEGKGWTQRGSAGSGLSSALGGATHLREAHGSGNDFESEVEDNGRR